jgi:hypothetical protein
MGDIYTTVWKSVNSVARRSDDRQTGRSPPYLSREVFLPGMAVAHLAKEFPAFDGTTRLIEGKGGGDLGVDCRMGVILTWMCKKSGVGGLDWLAVVNTVMRGAQ